MGKFLQHVLVERVYIQVIHIFKSTKKSHWLMDGLHINDTGFFTFNRFMLKGNWGKHRGVFHPRTGHKGPKGE
jgi:hypothetical protein